MHFLPDAPAITSGSGWTNRGRQGMWKITPTSCPSAVGRILKRRLLGRRALLHALAVCRVTG